MLTIRGSVIAHGLILIYSLGYFKLILMGENALFCIVSLCVGMQLQSALGTYCN